MNNKVKIQGPQQMSFLLSPSGKCVCAFPNAKDCWNHATKGDLAEYFKLCELGYTIVESSVLCHETT